MTLDDGRRDAAKALPIQEVAARLGIDGLRPAGVERVGPCPVCGGRDRFAINPPRGLFSCRSCAAGGDGLALVRHVLGCDFLGALDFLAGAPMAVDPAELARRAAKAAAAEQARADYEAQARARAIRDAREIWHSAATGAASPAEAYLAARGIRFAVWPPTLRFLPDHPYLKQSARRLVEWHRGPAMIAAIQDAAGKVLAVHQTWIDPARPGHKAAILDPEGAPAPAKLVRGSKKGGAIRLTGASAIGTLVMGEGIETTASALTAEAAPGAAYWAGVDLGNMSGRMLRQAGIRYSGRPDPDDLTAWTPPPWVTRLLLIQDGDSEAKMTRARLESCAARARLTRPDLWAAIVHPGAGADLNDLLQTSRDERPKE